MRTGINMSNRTAKFLGAICSATAFGLLGCNGLPAADDASAADAQTSDAGPDDCPGPRPSADDCQFGLFHASCGDAQGEPTLACHEMYGTCSWFDGACVPVGYRASDCFPNACCHDSSGGTWPFRDAWQPSEPGSTRRAIYDLEAMDEAVVTGSSPLGLTVTTDATIGAPASREIACSPENPLRFCGPEILSSWVSRTDLSIVVRLASQSVAIEAVYVEILEDDLGSVHARAFLVQEPDTDLDPPPRCQSGLSARILGGTLSWNGRTEGNLEDLHGELELTLADGHWARASF